MVVSAVLCAEQGLAREAARGRPDRLAGLTWQRACCLLDLPPSSLVPVCAVCVGGGVRSLRELVVSCVMVAPVIMSSAFGRGVEAFKLDGAKAKASRPR